MLGNDTKTVSTTVSMRQSGKKKVNESADKTPARKTEPIYVQTGMNKNETKNDFSAR